MLEEATENLNKIKALFKDCTEEEREFAEMWAKLLEYPAPKFRRAAIDIEVYSPLSTRMPDAREAACPVIAVSVYSSDGEKRVLILKREGVREGNQHLDCRHKSGILSKPRKICLEKPLMSWRLPVSF